MHVPEVRKSGLDRSLSREEFKRRFLVQFADKTFSSYQDQLDELEEIAWNNYSEGGHKTRATQKAGSGYQDPDYELSIDWVETKKEIDKAAIEYKNIENKSRVLLINASSRNDQTCPGEISKTSRLTAIAKETLTSAGVEVEEIDLSLITSEYGKMIYPCKACVSTAMPLCHWPCSCYPNYSLGQTNDWMNEIYPMWIRAHGIMVITPVYWRSPPSALKLMMDRMVCADGGNPDPTSTKGKKADLAKKIELDGWDYPRHLEGRLYSVIVHGDTLGIDDLKQTLTSWMDEMMMIPSGPMGSLSRYIDYYGTYAESHEALDKDEAIKIEVKNASLALALNITAARGDLLSTLLPDLEDPRPK